MMNHIEMRKYEFHLTIPGKIPLKKYCLASSRLCPLPNVFSNSSSPRNPFQDWNLLPLSQNPSHFPIYFPFSPSPMKTLSLSEKQSLNAS